MYNNQYYQQPQFTNTAGQFGQQLFGAPGMNYGQQNAPRQKNVLTPEEMNILRSKTEKFSLALTQYEVLAGICLHVDEQGNDKLMENADGSYTCSICGTTFNTREASKEEVDEIVKQMTDILETIKLMYRNMPESAAREFYQIIPLIKKVPKLYDIAAEDFRRYDPNNMMQMNGNQNIFGMFNSIMNPGMMMGGGFAPQGQVNPQMAGFGQQGMGNPQMAGFGQQGMENPNMMPVQQAPGTMQSGMPGMSNGFSAMGGVQQPQSGYQAANSGFAYGQQQMGQQQMGQPQQQAPAQTAAQTAQPDVTVNTPMQP